MNELIPIFEVDGVPVTTSRAVAEQFGKQHKNVIQSIETLMQDLDKTEDGKAFNRLNFQPVNYTDAKGETRKQYTMTRDGFTLLAMGFTGARALQFKLAYINAFNRMEQLIRGGRATVTQLETTLDSLTAIDTAAEQGQGDVIKAVFSETLRALENAVNSGECSFYRVKGREISPTSDGEVIGGCDDLYLKVRTKKLYSLYAAGKEHPVIYTVWRDFMQRSGLKLILCHTRIVHSRCVIIPRKLVKLNIK